MATNPMFEDIIKRDIDEFLFNLTRIRDSKFNKGSVYNTYKAVHLGDDDFYRYKEFERVLEYHTRLLITYTITDMLVAIGVDVELLDNIESKPNTNTDTFEVNQSFEFIYTMDERRIGVRYTFLCDGDEALLKKFDLDEIRVLDWYGTDEFKKWNENGGLSSYKNDNIFTITPKDFLSTLFDMETYDLFMSKIIQAEESAKELIGFQTISILSPRNLSVFINMKLEEILNYDFPSLTYQIVNPVNRNPECSVYKNSREYINKYNKQVLYSYFTKDNIYECILGSESFAKCFITSEYMYDVFKNGGTFDYTSVICGYLKSVEQLLHKILLMTLEYNSLPDMWIKSKQWVEGKTRKKANTIQIPFQKENVCYFDITMNSMICFFEYYRDLWNVPNKCKNIICGYLRNYTWECRNEHFHKDNIDEFSYVEKIRNNTLLMFYLVLGGIKLSEYSDINKETLGIVDREFDRFYKRIKKIPFGIDMFIQFKGEEVQKVNLLYDQDLAIFDQDGSLQKSNIKFVKVDEFGELDYETYEEYIDHINPDRIIIVDYKNIPEKVWYLKYRTKEKIQIIW